MDNKYEIDRVVNSFFKVFSNVDREPDWNQIYDLCMAEALIIKKVGTTEEIYNLETFIQPRRKILSDGTLSQFKEWETEEQTLILGHIAQRSSTYRKSGLLNNVLSEGQGHKLFQFVLTEEGWKISSLVWEDFQNPD